MKVTAWNVNGIRSVLSKGALSEYLTQAKPDILLLQEVRALEEQIEKLLQSKPFTDYRMYFYPAEKKGYSGVAVWIRKDIQEPEHVQRGIPDFLDNEGRAIGVFLPGKVVCFSLYIPNGGKSPEAFQHKLHFMSALTAYTARLIDEGYSVVLGGDFNIAHHAVDLAQPEKHKGGTHFSDELTVVIDDLLKKGLIDTFRETHPDAKDMYSYWDNFDFSLPRGTKPREVNRGWRIDYLYSSNDLFKRQKRADIETEVMGSDHCPIIYEWK